MPTLLSPWRMDNLRSDSQVSNYKKQLFLDGKCLTKPTKWCQSVIDNYDGYNYPATIKEIWEKSVQDGGKECPSQALKPLKPRKYDIYNCNITENGKQKAKYIGGDSNIANVRELCQTKDHPTNCNNTVIDAAGKKYDNICAWSYCKPSEEGISHFKLKNESELLSKKIVDLNLIDNNAFKYCHEKNYNKKICNADKLCQYTKCVPSGIKSSMKQNILCNSLTKQNDCINLKVPQEQTGDCKANFNTDLFSKLACEQSSDKESCINKRDFLGRPICSYIEKNIAELNKQQCLFMDDRKDYCTINKNLKTETKQVNEKLKNYCEKIEKKEECGKKVKYNKGSDNKNEKGEEELNLINVCDWIEQPHSEILLKGGRAHEYCRIDDNNRIICDVLNKKDVNEQCKFKLYDLGDNTVALKSKFNEKYCKLDDVSNKLVCEQDNLSSHTSFYKENVKNEKDKFGLKSMANQKYCMDDVENIKCNSNTLEGNRNNYFSIEKPYGYTLECINLDKGKDGRDNDKFIAAKLMKNSNVFKNDYGLYCYNNVDNDDCKWFTNYESCEMEKKYESGKGKKYENEKCGKGTWCSDAVYKLKNNIIGKKYDCVRIEPVDLPKKIKELKSFNQSTGQFDPLYVAVKEEKPNINNNFTQKLSCLGDDDECIWFENQKLCEEQRHNPVFMKNAKTYTLKSLSDDLKKMETFTNRNNYNNKNNNKHIQEHFEDNKLKNPCHIYTTCEKNSIEKGLTTEKKICEKKKDFVYYDKNKTRLGACKNVKCICCNPKTIKIEEEKEIKPRDNLPNYLKNSAQILMTKNKQKKIYKAKTFKDLLTNKILGIDIDSKELESEKGYCKPKNNVSSNKIKVECLGNHDEIKCDLNENCEWHFKNESGWCDLKNDITNVSNINYKRADCRIRHSQEKCIQNDICQWDMFDENLSNKKNKCNKQ